MKKVLNYKYFSGLFGLSLLAYALPAVVFAQDFDELFEDILGWIDTLTVIIIALAFLFFLWGLALFILKAGDEGEREKGKKFMLWGIIAFVVMVGLWGIVNFITGALDIEQETLENIPQPPRR